MVALILLLVRRDVSLVFPFIATVVVGLLLVQTGAVLLIRPKRVFEAGRASPQSISVWLPWVAVMLVGTFGGVGGSVYVALNVGGLRRLPFALAVLLVGASVIQFGQIKLIPYLQSTKREMPGWSAKRKSRILAVVLPLIGSVAFGILGLVVPFGPDG